jgi:GH35 family endo-1,4-beta-xylanase
VRKNRHAMHGKCFQRTEAGLIVGILIAFFSVIFSFGPRACAEKLRNIADSKGVLFGAAIKHLVLDSSPDFNQKYAAHFTESFNMATLENAHKAIYVWRGPYDYHFEEADKIVNWCIQNGIEVKYHCIIWHGDQGVPEWLRNMIGTCKGEPDFNTKADIDGDHCIESDDLRVLTKDYIEAIFAHYKGKIKYYDVFSEWADEPNWWHNNFGFDKEGHDVLECSFKWSAAKAQELDMDAILIYNDYGIEDFYSQRGRKVYFKLTDLKRKSIRVDAVGFQSHFWCKELSESYLISHIQPQFEAFQSAGLALFVSEFDASPTSYQSETYYNYLKFCLKYGVTAFQMWNFWDGSVWCLPPETVGCPPETECEPGLFSKSWHEKATHYAFSRVLKDFFGSYTPRSPVGRRAVE